MARLPEVLDRNQLPEDKRHIFDYLASTRGSVRLPFSAVLTSPDVAERVSHLGSYIRFESSIPHSATELATLTVARAFNSRHEWAMHTGFAREAGVSEAAIDAIGRHSDLAGLDESEAFPVRFARELIEGRSLSDATLAAARERYGDKGAIDLTATVGYYAMMACLIEAIGIVPPETMPQLPA